MSFNPGGTGGISGASDIVLNNPVSDQSLAYNSSTQKWQNKKLVQPSLTYVGSSSNPVTTSSATRPSTVGPVFWTCAQGVTPANTINGDLINSGGVFTVAGGTVSTSPDEQEGTALSAFHAGLTMAPTKPVAIVYTGSSTTAGKNATASQYRYVNILHSYLQARYPSGGSESSVQASTSAVWTQRTTPGVHGYNAGEGGTTASSFLSADERTVIAALDPLAVSIMIGANDLRYDVNPVDYKANIEAAIVDIDAKMGRRPVYILTHSYPAQDSTVTGGTRYPADDYKVALQEITATDPSNIIFIDVSDDFAARGIPGDDPDNLLDTDLIHMTNSGHAFMATLLRDELHI